MVRTLLLMDALDIGRIVAGLVLLVLGGEFLVRGASALAGRFGISSLVIGLTVVSAATSAPEFAVSVGAVLRDEPGLAVGNAVGSNIINVLLILGLSALVVPLAVKRRLIRFDLPLMVVLSVLLLLVSLDGRISAVEGLILFFGVVVHTMMSVVISRRDAKTAVNAREGTGDSATVDPADEEGAALGASVGRSLFFVLLGVGLLFLRAMWRQFRERALDPTLDAAEDRWDRVEAAANEKRAGWRRWLGTWKSKPPRY